MASNNRVFVSPGVYTSEVDLTFVAQSVGVTTLGLVGETLKGPAFEPILITNFDEFKTYFGGTSPEKYGNGYPKYELPYNAKSYLQESNQLFVTRVLGLTGYKPNKSFAITAIGGIRLEEYTGYTDQDTSVILTSLSSFSTSFNDYQFIANLTAVDGSSMDDYIVKNFSGYTSADNLKWFAIGKIEDYLDDANITLPSTKEQVSPLTGKLYEDSPNNKEWYNSMYHVSSGADEDNNVDAVYSYVFQFFSGATPSFTGNTPHWEVTKIFYDATPYTEYNNSVIATLRSRGRYVANEILELEVTNDNAFTLEVDTDNMAINPLGDFFVNVTGATGGVKQFGVSFNTASTKFISKVFGTETFDKTFGEFPVYVHEVYPNLLKKAYEKGLIRGIKMTATYVDEDVNDNFLKGYDTPISPMIVSEVRGGNVADLFEVITISDGETANVQVKITIQNINVDTSEFDILVRDFNDTDDNQVVLEKYSRCSMNPDVPGYVARKIGTSDGEYPLNSKYIMLNMATNAPTDAFPAGFKGLPQYNDAGLYEGAKFGNIAYKTKYNVAGDIETYTEDGIARVESGDKVRKVMLGVSSEAGFDSDLLKYKGASAEAQTFGFHLSYNAAHITGATSLTVDSKGVSVLDLPNISGNTVGFAYMTTPYDLEGQSDPIDGSTNYMQNINYRKFTTVVFGGRDGWDIYRQNRTNSDEYIFGKKTYFSGNTLNNGVFSETIGNSDYYSYLQGIETYANPEAIDINVFATPGINFFQHSSLVNQAIEMIESDRADSLYIMNSPGPVDVSDSDSLVGELDLVSIDSNYSATYWPWIQVRDTDNATQIYLPPTGEVLRNIALTDNVSYPWFAVAGYSRGLVTSIKAAKKLTLDERDTLYKNRVNPIATFSDTGTIIWGNKTLQVRESALDRINVRRLLLRARKLISAVSVRLLFEQNDEQVRNEFLKLVNPILDSIKKERGLYDFRVSVSNDPADIDANTLRGKIYIKPTRSLEYIDLEFVITPTGASFENI
jgi:hypothetical protein